MAGLAVGAIRGGALTWFHGYGLADIGSGTPVGEDTVLRIDSVTKTMTAIVVMQCANRDWWICTHRPATTCALTG